ncbi:MAG: hypothetical protein WC683_05945 [bacterium]
MTSAELRRAYHLRDIARRLHEGKGSHEDALYLWRQLYHRRLRVTLAAAVNLDGMVKLDVVMVGVK